MKIVIDQLVPRVQRGIVRRNFAWLKFIMRKRTILSASLYTQCSAVMFNSQHINYEREKWQHVLQSTHTQRNREWERQRRRQRAGANERESERRKEVAGKEEWDKLNFVEWERPQNNLLNSSLFICLQCRSFKSRLVSAYCIVHCLSAVLSQRQCFSYRATHRWLSGNLETMTYGCCTTHKSVLETKALPKHNLFWIRMNANCLSAQYYDR